jgi:hypothetical protein
VTDGRRKPAFRSPAIIESLFAVTKIRTATLPIITSMFQLLFDLLATMLLLK